MDNIAQLKPLNIKLFVDTSDKKIITEMSQYPWIKGFTTNPSLMRKAGVTDYYAFVQECLGIIKNRSISFEVFADDLAEMEKQAYQIAAWGENIAVKMPVTNTKGEFTGDIIQKLANSGVRLNVTAIFTLQQVQDVADCLAKDVPAIVSVFAGRIADTGVDPLPIMQNAVEIIKELPEAELLWASPRELLNVVQANDIGCHIITATTDILNKLSLIGKNLEEYSLEAVKLFYKDALAAGFELPTLEVA